MNRYIARLACLEKDREEIIELWTRNGVNSPDPEKHFDWAYINNPAGRGFLWLLRKEPSDLAIGSFGLILRQMKINNSISLVGRGGGFAIDKSHRTLGPALMIQKAMLKEYKQLGIDYVNTVAPPHASPVVKRLGFNHLGERVTVRKTLRSSRFVENRMPFFPPLAQGLVSNCLDLSISLSTRGRNFWSRPKQLSRIVEFDSSFDELWNRAEPNYQLTSKRSAAFLNWRFSNNPKNEGIVCDALKDVDGSLRGYVVYKISDKTAIILDLFALDQKKTISGILSSLSRQLRSDGIMFLSIGTFGSESFLKSLWKSGFWVRDDEPVGYGLYFYSPKGSGTQFVCDGSVWGFLKADDFSTGF